MLLVCGVIVCGYKNVIEWFNKSGFSSSDLL